MFLIKNDPSSSLADEYRMLDYPINANLILRKKHSIKKALLVNDELIPKNIAFLGGSTTSEIRNILELFLLNIGIKPNFYESEYNKYYEDAVFENKELREFKPDVIYIHTTNKNITSYPLMSDSPADVERIYQYEETKYKNIWSSLNNYHCPLIQNNFEFPQYRILGNLDAYEYRGALNYIHRLNAFFADEARKRASLYLNDINYIAASLGLAHWFDRHLWYSSKYALSYEAIPHLAKSLAAIIGGLFGQSKKGMILDLDNTCWGGYIGESGLNGIAIGKETAEAEAYSEFQTYAKSLKERGVMLAVCSKNELSYAKEGFTHPDSVLVSDDFAAFEANWEPKHINVLKISEELNIGLDSLVFIDDNPAERQIVSENLSTVIVPAVGADVVRFIDYIDKNYYFETVSILSEDVKRADFYKQNAERLQRRLQFVDYADYLQSLEMVADIQPFSSMYLDRITQLINKTNQFNLTNKRYTFTDVELIAEHADYISLYGRLSDRFGDNGLVSGIIGKIHGHECHIELWVMSCRVLKRTMEEAMFDTFVSRCRTMGIETIIGYYLKTAKNAMVAHLYEDFKFDVISTSNTGSVWCLQVNRYKNNNNQIKVKT